MENDLNELLTKEQQMREAKKYTECLDICHKILKNILNYKEKEIFDIISKILLYKNQSNYVRIGIIFNLIYNNYININDNNNLKRKYYQLLIDSFKKDLINDKPKEKSNIIKYYEESELKNFDKLDSFLLTLDCTFINEKTNSTDRDIFAPSENQQNIKYKGNNIIENNDLEEDLIRDDSQQNQITQIGFVNNINDKNFDMNNIIPNNNVNTNEKYLMKKYKPNNKLPMILISVSVYLNSKDFMDLINTTFAKLNYRNVCTIKSNLHDNMNIYEYNPNNFIKKLAFCLVNRRNILRNIFQVVVILKKDENNFSSGLNYYLNDNYERKISIKTVRGSEKNVINFMIKFLKLFSHSVNKIKIIKQTKTLSKYNLDEIFNNQIQNKKDVLLKSINYPKKKNQNLTENETLVEISNRKANQYYEIYKSLSNTEYDLGKSIFDFIENFKKKYNELMSPNAEEKIENINTRPIMGEIIKMIESCTNTLNCNFNNNNNNINYNSDFFATASEQFIFNKIYHYLYEIYDKKYKNMNDEYLSIKKDINTNMSIKDIMANIGVNDKYKGEDEFPYKTVIENVNKVSYEKYLKNKFEILTQSSLEMRGCILEYTNGKDDLESLDEELPIIIYIATQINIENIFAELNMLDDYIKCRMRDDLVQNKMVTNLLSSATFISKAWDTELKNFKS